MIMYKTIKMTKYIIILYKKYSQTCFSDHLGLEQMPPEQKAPQ